ncbi:MAG TPA: ABC transporter permease [Stellaceae bacterium]|nr:ABC transporter permease [Stellaceae bacterium]
MKSESLPAAQAAAPPVEVDADAERWRRQRRIEKTLSVLSPLALLALWQLAALAGEVDTRFFPAPSAVFEEAWGMIQSGELWLHLSISLSRIAVGFTLGAVPGIAIGLAVGLFRPVRAIVQPLIDATFPIPKIAILPLFIMIFGLGEESKYAIIATAVIYLVMINTAAGVHNIDKIYLDVGKNFGAGKWMMFTDVALPGALPLIVAGLKLGMGVALLVIVSAEFVGAKSGIGYLIWTSWQVFQVEKMYVGLLVCALLGFGAAILLNLLERVLIPWKQR